ELAFATQESHAAESSSGESGNDEQMNAAAHQHSTTSGPGAPHR
ncbi:MAG: hypothetical protein RI885_2219, partial [Actinomycetota bacterium]